MPCLICRARQERTKAIRRPGAMSALNDRDLDLQLRPNDRARYEEVCEARRILNSETLDPAERAA